MLIYVDDALRKKRTDGARKEGDTDHNFEQVHTTH
jgi:hypothetical protein